MTLAKFLADENLSQGAFAAKLGVRQSEVSRWLSGLRVPGGELAFAIQRITGGKVPAESWYESRKRHRSRRVA